MSVSEESFNKGLEQLEKMGRGGSMLDQLELSEDLYRMSVGTLFGEIWTRGHLSLRERQLIVLGANIAMARPQGNHSHYNSANHIGITHEEIMEVIMQVGMYTGWPTMALAVKQYHEVLAERGEKPATAPKT
jgi:4-carboxymuconolactone decarboxylase